MVGLLGINPSRQFKIYRAEFPAIFRFNGKLFIEVYDGDNDTHFWDETTEDIAKRYLDLKRRS